MANYPTNDPSNSSLMVQVNNLSGTLNATITSAATSLTLQNSSAFPVAGFVTIESEAIEYSGNATATGILSGLTRGADSTTAAQHDGGLTVYANIVAAHHNRLKDEIIAIGSDLRNCFDSDLNDAQSVTITAANLKMRLDQISTRLAALGNSTDWKSGSPGKHLGATQAAYNSSTQTAATTFTSTGLQVTLTLNTTTSRVRISCNLNRAGSDLTNTGAHFTFFRGATDLATGSTLGFGKVSEGVPRGLPVHLQYLDSPGTNGSVTYTVFFRSDTTTANAYIAGSGPSLIIAEPISA
jgi:hypothetical protein